MIATSLDDFLASTAPFDRLELTSRQKLLSASQPYRYRLGQAIVVRDSLPAQVSILVEGQVRLLGYPSGSQVPITLQLLSPGAIIGGISLIRGIPTETAIASTEAICLTLPASDFLQFIKLEPLLAESIQNRASVGEIFEILAADLVRQARSPTDIAELTLKAYESAVVLNLPPGKTPFNQLAPDLTWWISSGAATNFPVGSRVIPQDRSANIEVAKATRLIGWIWEDISQEKWDKLREDSDLSFLVGEIAKIPYAPERPPQLETPAKSIDYPHVKGTGAVNGTLACFQMLAQYSNIPFKRDVIQKVLTNSVARHGVISFQLCGAVGELIGLNSQLVNIPVANISRIPTPALISWEGSYAIMYATSDRQLILGIPELGIRHFTPDLFKQSWGESGQVLLLQPTPYTPKEQFNLSWFLPSIQKYRRIWWEVLLASLFVQLFGLANPLITQVIIDKVILQKSVATLNVLGIFLLLVAIFEGIISTLRTNLFVDTTNRIDMALGSQVIDHLLRLPLRYFDRRPVGELSTRVNELENIRQFMTGTALTVVLDAIFSVVYIVVMLLYSWLLTLIALATVPLFALLTFIVAPLIRRQSRTKAERNAETQSYLVEVVSGIQTVKAQNIELHSRWQWQERYARYVSAGFNSALTSTTAGSVSNFLNKLSGLLLLWVGASLVLQGQLTLGELIAFRIIAGYTTSPLLRLIQLWQNFQETALSLERLGDILNYPQEMESTGSNQIPMPEIKGAVRYENVSFRFANTGDPQLFEINLDLPAGAFIGVVGTSGAGKSTLTKLLPRLYEPDSGRILIDGYDIGKVELYSLRRQMGVVLQDTLLFDGTVQENIALSNPDATQEEIITAAQVAVAHDFIMSLPQGYNTRVGERGSALSGGQRQRIAIARTVLQNPQLLVLDEATSALDYQTERLVCQNLAQAFQGRTVFFITHRLATIQSADLILMMESAMVVERGSHDELMALQGRYYYLFRQQNRSLA
jgi:HlyB family type I secretion system ABC transporter